MKLFTPSQYSRGLGIAIKAKRLSHSNKSLRTQAEFAEKVGINRSYFSGIENGSRMPGLENLSNIAEVLGVRLSELLEDAEKRIEADKH